MNTRPAVVLDDVSKTFDSGLQALASVSLQAASGEFLTLLGPSGCGKSSVLKLIAGLDTPTTGSVISPATQAPGEAATAFVFQDPTLMPWANVFDNIALPLRLAGASREMMRARIAPVLATVGLTEFAGSHPAQLSGGMRMRVSLARALVTQPRVLLMDEPFAALDEITRARLNQDLLAWWIERQLTVVFVTHSVYEAVFLSQRVLVMGARPGRILEEVEITAPYPRATTFRTSLEFQQACARLTAALDRAQAGAPA
ncbi:MAG: ABC transporter ATP-binding protein [Gammaproteobacteria bacterium]|nr:ABC transporter ATP-binding protein [Gammaproteobacteria bacterium]